MGAERGRSRLAGQSKLKCLNSLDRIAASRTGREKPGWERLLVLGETNEERREIPRGVQHPDNPQRHLGRMADQQETMPRQRPEAVRIRQQVRSAPR